MLMKTIRVTGTFFKPLIEQINDILHPPCQSCELYEIEIDSLMNEIEMLNLTVTELSTKLTDLQDTMDRYYTLDETKLLVD